jgi:integrase
MAHLVRPVKVYYTDKTGKRVPKGTPGAKKVKERARKWYAQGVPGLPPKKRVPLASNKDVARRMLADLVTKGEQGLAGQRDKAAEAMKCPLTQHLDDFEASLKAKGKTPAHVTLTMQRVRDTAEACAWAGLADIDADAVMNWLASRRELPRAAGGLSVRSCNYYIGAVNQFCRWLVQRERIKVNPMANAEKGNPDLDPRHQRRDLGAPELFRLLDAVRKSGWSFRGLSGPDRYALYLTACGTGFRVSELASLTPGSFELDADPPTAALDPTVTKNRRPVVQPLPAVVAEAIRVHAHGRAADQPLWPGTWTEKAAKMLRHDEEAVGIPYVVRDAHGRSLHADFHALRHTFISWLERPGATPKVHQDLARHGDYQKLTLGTYSHATQAAMAQALDRLPLPGAQQEVRPPDPHELAAAVILLATVLGGILYPTGTDSIVIPSPVVDAPRVAPAFGTGTDNVGQLGTENGNEGRGEDPSQVEGAA